MYRKKLMRACLAGIMAATVVTQSVPAYAAEPTKQEAAKLRTITIQYQDENGIVGTYDLYAQPEDVAAVSAKVVKAHLPEGCELVNEQDNYEVKADGTVVVTVKNNNQPEKPVSKSVKINFYDEENGKQAAEVEVQNLAVDTAALGLNVVKSYLPEGYELVKEENSYAVADGYVYVGVKPIKAEPEKPVSKSVKINFYDEENGKQAAEVEVQNLAVDTAALGLNVVKSYLPEGYELVKEENSYAVADGYVYVGVKPIKAEPEKPVSKSVKINFYDEENGKQAAEVEVQNLAVDTAALGLKVVKSYLPEGYELVKEENSYAVSDGYVYVGVKPIKAEKPEAKITALRVVYKDEATQEVVGGETLTGGRQNEEGKYVFSASVDFNIPEGYELAVNYPDVELAEGEVSTTECLVKKVSEPEKPVSKSVKINFYDEENGKQAAEVEVQNLAVDTAALGLNVVKSYLPEGYELVKEENSYAVADGYVYVGVKPIKAEPEKPVSKSVKINFYDEENGKQAAEVEVQNLAVDTAALGLNVVKSYLPEGYELVTEENSYAVSDGYVYVGVKPIKAEPEKPVSKSVKINFYDEENGKQAAEVEVQNLAVDTAALGLNIVKNYLPEGYELVTEENSYAVSDGYVYVGVKPLKAELESLVTKSVRINFYDEENGKQAAEVEVENLATDTAALGLKVVKSYLPEGYELVTEENSYAVADGYVYVGVKPIKAEKPVTKSVRINFYDEENGKQAAEVEVQNLAADTAALGLKVVKSYLPEGYELVTEENSYAVADGYVYVGVKPIKAEKPVTKSVRINFYDEENGKQAAEVEVQNLAADTAALGLKVVKSYLPEGYKLVTEENSYAIVDGYVYVGVKPIKAEKPEAKVTALRVIYKDEATQEVVGGETLTGGRQNEEGKYVFSASVDFNIPEGYELAVNYPDFELVEGEVSTTECLVKKASEFEYAKVTYVDADNGEYVVGYGTAKVEKGATYFNTSILNDLPYGYELATLGDVSIVDGVAEVGVRKVKEEAPEYVKVTYVDADNGEYVVGYGTAKVEKGATYFNTSILTDVPYGYEIAEVGDMPIANGEAIVKVRKIDNVQEVTITYVHKTTGAVVGYGKLNAYKNEAYFNTSRLTDIPEGYVLADAGDMPIENGAATVYVYAATDMEELQPSTPVVPSKPVEPSKPEKPNKNEGTTTDDKKKDDKKDNKKDDKKTSAKTGDETNPIAAVLPAGISLAAILALLKKRK